MDFDASIPNRIIGHPLHLVSFESATWRVGFQSAPVVSFRLLRGLSSLLLFSKTLEVAGTQRSHRGQGYCEFYVPTIGSFAELAGGGGPRRVMGRNRSELNREGSLGPEFPIP